MPDPRNIQKNPASGRPMMRDVVGRTKRQREALPQKEPVQARKLQEKAVISIKKEKKFSLPGTKTIFILTGIVVVLGIGFWAITFFAGAHVLITPRQEFVDVQSSISASATSSRQLALEVVSLEDEIELEDSIQTMKSGSEKARGQAMIYNNYSTEPQPLVANTRLEAPGGKIYRTSGAVTVPGAKMEGGNLSPRGIEVTVISDKPGPEYNLGLSDFTIPGFKGTAKYEKFYARSKTEIKVGPPAGGSGSSKVVSKENVDQLTKQASERFRSNLKERMKQDLPREVFILEDALEVKVEVLETNPPINSAGDKVRIKVRARGEAMAVKKSDVARALAEAHLELRPGEEVEVRNFDNLRFEVLAKDFKEREMKLKITGRAHFVWLFDEEKLKGELAGATRATRQEVFKNYPGIERAEINFKPVWWHVFPQSPFRIRIEQIFRTE